MNILMSYRASAKRIPLAVLGVILLFGVASPVFGQSAKEQQDQQQPTIKIGTNLVVAPVIVTDRYGRFVTGLDRDDFAVREDGAPQKIEDFSSTEAPFNVALLIDTSRSTQNKLDKIRKAALTFIRQLLPNDRVMVVGFDEQVRFVCEFTNNQAELERAIKSLKTSYLTSLYDAIHLTINEKMSRIRGRKAIVALTDGVDTASKQATFESVIDLVASVGIICYAVQYETRNDGGPVMKPMFIPGVSNSFVPRSSAKWREPAPQQPKTEPEKGAVPSTRVNQQPQQPLRDRYLIAADFLRTLAAQSGALHLRAENIENTSYAFAVIANELHHQYTLTYISTNEQRDGRYRTIAVQVKNPDLIVRPRMGYRAPKGEPSETEQSKKPDSKPER
jgi:VWFA-related protein